MSLANRRYLGSTYDVGEKCRREDDKNNMLLAFCANANADPTPARAMCYTTQAKSRGP